MKNIISIQRISFYILYFTFFIVIASCSVQKEISRSAKEDVLNNKALETAHVGISIYDATSNKYLYNYQGEKYFVPASNTKIPTCYAAMKYLGDSLIGLRYNIVNDSTIRIKPTGDPSFLVAEFKTQPVFNFLKKYKYIVFDDYFFTDDFLGSGWTWNDYMESYAAQRSNFPIYGNVVKFRWVSSDSIVVAPNAFTTEISITESIKDGFELRKPWDENKFVFMNGKEKNKEVPFRPDGVTIAKLLRDTLKNLITPAYTLGENVPYSQYYFYEKGKSIMIPNFQFGSAILNKLHSQPTDSLLKPMMHRSDNFFAEQSLLMVSNELLDVMNDEKIIDTLLKTDFKDLPQKPRWVDGSGLSRYNLFTPQDFVTILHKMKNEFGMERIKNIFATGGEGTLSSYYKDEKGFIFGKTGTLSGVVAFSGFLYTKKGKLLIFSTLVNNHRASATDVRRAVEKFIEGIRSKF